MVVNPRLLRLWSSCLRCSLRLRTVFQDPVANQDIRLSNLFQIAPLLFRRISDRARSESDLDAAVQLVNVAWPPFSSPNVHLHVPREYNAVLNPHGAVTILASCVCRLQRQPDAAAQWLKWLQRVLGTVDTGRWNETQAQGLGDFNAAALHVTAIKALIDQGDTPPPYMIE